MISAGKLFQVTSAAYDNERLTKSVVSLGMVSSGSAVERVSRVATCGQG